jgi:hypothetical protein
MTVTSGGNLTFTGSGVINASQLGGKGLAGSGAAVASGPTTSVAGHVVTFADSGGGEQDSGVSIASVILGLQNNGVTVTPSSGIINFIPGTNMSFSVTGNAITFNASTSGYGGTNLVSTYTNATTSYTSVMALPSIPVSTTVRGRCFIAWSDNNTLGSLQFAMGLNNNPTDLYVMPLSYSGTSSPIQGPQVVITSASTTSILTTSTPLVALTTYPTYIDFLLVNGGSGANILTLYAKSNSATYTGTVAAGSYCSWLP